MRYPNFNVDVYLDSSDEQNACVWAVPGSHLGGHHDDQASTLSLKCRVERLISRGV